jgi:hypothetical protein
MVESNVKVSIPQPQTTQVKFTFKLVNLGSFFQDMPDGVTVLNRPCVRLDASRKKWGNEYLLFNKIDADNLGFVDGGDVAFAVEREMCFVGIFGVDRNKKKQIRFLRDLGIPITKPDYFIIVVDHTGEKLDKEYDITRADPNSYSQIFSSAFHYNEETDNHKCQTMFVLQHGDFVTINHEKYVFSGKNQTLEKM